MATHLVSGVCARRPACRIRVRAGWRCRGGASNEDAEHREGCDYRLQRSTTGPGRRWWLSAATSIRHVSGRNHRRYGLNSTYTVSDQENKPIGRDVDEAVVIATELVAQIREMLAACNWRVLAQAGGSRAWRTAATTATNYLRDATNPLNAADLGADRLASRSHGYGPVGACVGAEFLAKAQAAPNAHLAIEALRKSLTDAGSSATRGNLVRRRAFSERIAEIMNRYTNLRLTSAEVIAERVELAKEVAAEASRGSTFSPPLSSDELAFCDAVATNESTIDVQGEEVLAQIARELVAVMRRDVRTDWTVRDDVRAKLRSSIKRLLVKYKYPPDRQPEAIKLVMDQMESMAPRYADERAP